MYWDTLQTAPDPATAVAAVALEALLRSLMTPDNAKTTADVCLITLATNTLSRSANAQLTTKAQGLINLLRSRGHSSAKHAHHRSRALGAEK